MKVCINPYSTKENKYIDLITKSIEMLNAETCKFDIKEIDKVDFYVLNWYEGLHTDKLYKYIYRFIKKNIKLSLLKIKDKKIIWVVHNRLPHDTKYPIFSRLLMRSLAKKSYKIVIHSEESRIVLKDFLKNKEIMKKCFYVPHPNYIGAYKESYNNLEPIKDDMLELLFIGAIRPYKNVDLLINVFNELNLPNVKLKLCGKVVNQEYELYINNLINNNPNIITEFRFIEDDELNELIKKAHILVLPYDIKSSLNSGTIMLGFSNKKTVLSPMIGTLKDFDDKSLFFGYEYTNVANHSEELKNSILKIYEIYKADKNIISIMGNRCYQEVKENNSIEKVSDALSYVFK